MVYRPSAWVMLMMSMSRFMALIYEHMLNLSVKSKARSLSVLVLSIIFWGNYIRVDTTTSDDKNYLNQQPKQLVSYLSLRFERFFQQHSADQRRPRQRQKQCMVSTGI